MVIITIGADGKPSERKLTISNKFENIDEILEFKLPANFETYNKYLIGVLEEEPNNRVAILPVLDNRVAISSMISYHPGKWQLYLMAREMKIDLDKPKIDISAKNNEHVFISDPIMGIVRDNLLNKEQIENAPLDSNLQIVYDEIMALITQVRTDLENGNYDGISPIVSFNKVQNGNEMSVTDRDGTKKILIKDGKNYEHSEEFNQLAEQVRQDKLSADASAKKAQESMNATGTIKGQVETLKGSIDKTALDIASKSEDVTNKHTQVTQAAQQVETNKVAVQDLAKQVQTNADSANASKESASLSTQTATTKAQEALTSATNAKASETASAKAQESAEASAGIATTKAQEALKSAQDAAQHNANASTSSAEATKAAAQAQASASSASQSEANAKASETASATSASNAKASEMASKTSETNAHLSEEAALTSKNAAKASENIATAKATEASKSATQALESKNAASTSATQASNSAQAAKTSETSAMQSKNSAAESATAAKTSEDNAKISETKAATSEANAKQSELNAKASETASKSSETNAKASETVASTKAQEASTSAQTASQKATIAETSANKAKASETNAKTSETNASKSAAAAKASETATGQVVADATAQADRAKTEADRAKTNADTVASSTQKITDNAEQITKLKQDLTKCMIGDIARGNPTIIEDSADWLVQGLNIYGQSEQNGTPTPDTPIPIINKEVSRITIVGDDERKQEIALSQPITLRGIPVSNNGNVVINGHSYLSDILCERNGVIGVVRNSCEEILDDKTIINFVDKPSWSQTVNCSLWDVILSNIHVKSEGANCSKMNILKHHFDNNDEEHFYINDRVERNISLFILDSRLKTVDIQGAKEWLSQNKPSIVYRLETPTFEPLPQVDQEAIKSLTTYYPNTTINSGAWNEVAYIADPKLFIEKQHKNIQSQLYELQSNLITAKISGGGQSNPIVLRDSSNMKFKSLKMYGQSEQLQTRGINLLHGNRVVKGYNIMGFVNNLKPNTQYTYSNSLSDENSAFKLIAYDSVSKTEIGLSIGYITSSRNTFTTPENIGDYNQLYLGGNHRYAGEYCINDNFQVEEGSVATAYEPYTGCKPSPSLEYPQKINSKEISEIRINGDDNKIQSVVLSEPISLNGIQVSSGGNVTIDGQQYISDVLCKKNGVIGVERYCGYIANYIDENVGDTYISTTGELSQGASVLYKLEVPTFEPLPYVDQEAIKNLTSYYPTTNIYVGAYSEVEYIADTKSYIDNKITSISTAMMKGV